MCGAWGSGTIANMAWPLTTPMPDVGERKPVIERRAIDGTFERPTVTAEPRVGSSLVGRRVA